MTEEYPRLQKVQRMLEVIDRALKEAENQGDPEVRVRLVRGGGAAKVELTYRDWEARTSRNIDLVEELGLGIGETIGLFRWAESEGYIRPRYGSSGRGGQAAIGVLDHLESKGYELIGELPDPQKHLSLILDAAMAAAVQAADRPEEKKKWQGLREDFRFVLRTLGVEGAKAVLRGDIPPL